VATIRFLASGEGRVARIAAGVILIGAGLFELTGTAGAIVAIVGVVPVLAGVFDVCIFAPLFGQPFTGAAIRRQAV